MKKLLSQDPPPVLVVVAHQDDETIGAGALLARLPDCRLLHLTDGATREARFVEGFVGTREEYAAARRSELASAMAVAGVGPERLFRVEGVVDQEACLALPRLAREVARLCRELRPGIVLTLAYEGGHPDHDAAAFVVHAAVELLRRQGEDAPEIVEMPLYHARPGTTRGDDLVKQQFLPSPGEAVRRELAPEERDLKLRMCDCFTTQRHIVAWFLPPIHESFRRAPAYDFTRPPHAGKLQYELWSFPVTGERWRELAREASGELRLE
ncbi:MAG: PIG-L family deacetylase [Acidobacteria bacterium]|nr:PIG-L family deacetylase [Acidobacteriota bacterium]